MVLSPSGRHLPRTFRNIQDDSYRHQKLLAALQRFRGAIYLADGAIDRFELTSDGRHHSTLDDRCWHLLSLDSAGNICACLRYVEQNDASGIDDLWVRHAAAVRSTLGHSVRTAVEREINRARGLGLAFVEVGGWAVADSHRRTLEPLRIILAAYGLARLLGGCIGVATATCRHSSADILRRIGLNPMQHDGAELPPYFDPRYDCQMELLRFDSRAPNIRYEDSVSELASDLSAAPIIRHALERPSLAGALLGLDQPATEPVLA